MFPGPLRRPAPRAWRLLLAAASVCALSLALAAAASASTVEYKCPPSNCFGYYAATGEVNAVSTTVSAGTNSGTLKVVFNDPGITITTSAAGCVVSGAGNDTATCDNVPNQAVLVNLGDGNDSNTASGPFQALGTSVHVFGGSGNDTLAGGDGNDFFDGDQPNGAGDANAPAVGDDTIDGGTGFDTVQYFFEAGPVTATLNGTATATGETDTLTNLEELWGSQFADVLSTDGTGGKTLRGMGGDDMLNSDDGHADTIDCDFAGFAQSPGTADVANVDAVDTVVAGSDDPNNKCETINRSTKNLGGGGTGGGTTGGATTGGGGGGAPAPAPATTATTPPATAPAPATIAVPVLVPQSSQLLVAAGSVTTALKGSLFLIPGISEQCTAGPCQVLERVYLLTGSARAALNHPIARDRDMLQSGGVNSARLRLNHKASRQLKRKGKLRVEGLVTLTDAKGKTQTVRKKFTLRARKG